MVVGGKCSSCCRAWALALLLSICRMWAWHVGSSRVRGRTRVSCVGRWILFHEPPGESPSIPFLSAYPSEPGAQGPQTPSSKHPRGAPGPVFSLLGAQGRGWRAELVEEGQLLLEHSAQWPTLGSTRHLQINF